MTKQTVKERIESISWHDLEGMDVEDILTYFQQFDRNAVLDVEYGYDCDNSGVLNIQRLETDEEEAKREAIAAKEKADREYQAEWTRLRRKEDAEKLATSQKAAEVALGIYLQKHEGNARIDDLKNLFMTLVQLERDGHPDSGAAMREVRECMELLEKQ